MLKKKGKRSSPNRLKRKISQKGFLAGFRRSKKTISIARVRRRKQWGQQAKYILKILALFIIIIGLGTGIFFIVRQIKNDSQPILILNKIKKWFDFSGESLSNKKTLLTVQGLPDALPVVPESTFVFKSILQESSPTKIKDDDLRAIYQFLSSNQSVYLLPLDYTFAEAIQFYKTQLADLGWEYTAYYEPGSKDQVAGAYWINQKKKRGLHLYEVSRDIWYESITIKEAQNGLASRVEAYKLQQFAVKTMAGNKVPEITGWNFYYSGEWKLQYAKNNFFDVYNIILEDQENSARIQLVPIARIYKKVVDIEYQDIVSEAEKYLQTINEKSVSKINLSSYTTKNLLINQQKAIEYKLVSNSKTKEQTRLLFLIHKKQQIIYLLEINNTTANTLEYYQYLQKNLREVVTQ